MANRTGIIDESISIISAPVGMLIIGVVVGSLVTYYFGVRLKMFKKIPNFSIRFGRDEWWYPTMEEGKTGKWIEENADWLYDYPKHDILSIKPPTDLSDIFNSKLYKWFYSFPPYQKIERFERDCIEQNIHYSRGAEFDNGCDVWYVDRGNSEEKDLKQERLTKVGGIWWIFYFLDDDKGREHCYCTRFFYDNDMEGWDIERDLLKRHYGIYGLLHNTERRRCWKCPFKKRRKGELN